MTIEEMEKIASRTYTDAMRREMPEEKLKMIAACNAPFMGNRQSDLANFALKDRGIDYDYGRAEAEPYACPFRCEGCDWWKE